MRLSALCLLFTASAWAQAEWTVRNPLPVPNDLLAVAHGAGLIVAVGKAGAIATSPDGLAWTLRPSGCQTAIRGIAWSGTAFAAVCDGGTTLASADGIAWTTHSLGKSRYVPRVAWGGGRFVALGLIDNAAYSSTDGKAWKASALPADAFALGIVWGGSRWVAVGETGLVLTSPDGEAWTRVPRFTGIGLRMVAWNGSAFFTRGDAAQGSDSVFTSPDGEHWTARYSRPESGAEVDGLVWTGSQFLALGGYPNSVWSSPDGLAWTMRDTGGAYFKDAVQAGGRLIAVGGDGRISVSGDGTAWAPATPGRRNDFNSVAWGGDRFVAIERYGILFSSRDGIAWDSSRAQARQVPGQPPAGFYSGNRGGIAYGNGSWVLTGESGYLATSPDGIAWTVRESSTRNDIRKALWIGDRWVAIAEPNGMNQAGFAPGTNMISSPDGIVWKAENAGSGYTSIAWSGTRLAATDEFGSIESSGDSLFSFTERVARKPMRYRSIMWAGSRFVAFGNGGAAVSPDGIAWKPIPLDSGVSLGAAVWDGRQIVAVGRQGQLYTSPDGEAWTARYSHAGNGLGGIAWNGSMYVVVGEGGIILTGAREDGNGLRPALKKNQRPFPGWGFFFTDPLGIRWGIGADGRFRPRPR